jgi:hypothetical protein
MRCSAIHSSWIKFYLTFFASFAFESRLKSQMRKVLNNSKAILSAISLVFLSYAGADAAVGIVEHHHVGILSARDHAVSGHGILNRKLNQGRSNEAVAIIPAAPFAPSLAFAGIADSSAVSSHSVSCPRAASARAPPLS